MPTVLVILADGFEEIEAFVPVDLLRRAGIAVTTASLSDTRHVTGRSRITAHTDATLAGVGDQAFDLVLLPGGAGVELLRADPRVAGLVRHHAQAGAWIAAICAAPVLLLDCGLLANRKYTAHFSVADELPDILSQEKVVLDGRICTSRGAGPAVEFGLRLVALLRGEEQAADIAKAICL